MLPFQAAEGMIVVAKKLLAALILLIPLFLSAGPAAAQGDIPYQPYAIYVFPSIISPAWFQAEPFVNQVYRPEAFSAPGSAIDQNGIMYYVVSERDSVLAASPVFEWDDLLKPYEFWIIGITSQGQRFMFAWGQLPLKSYIDGISFNRISGNEDVIDGRILLCIRTLVLDQVACPFLVPLDAAAAAPKAYDTKALAQASSTGAWDLSAMEGCFREELSLFQINGYFERMPEFAPGFVF